MKKAFRTFELMKKAVREGKEVRWHNDGYKVTVSKPNTLDEEFHITFTPNGHTVGLCERQYLPKDFYHDNSI